MTANLKAKWVSELEGDDFTIVNGNGTVLELTDPQVSKDFRVGLRKSTCARFATVLGPGSDGYHENHVHVDLAERAGGRRLCQWEVREPGEEVEAVPLPVPRPSTLGHYDSNQR